MVQGIDNLTRIDGQIMARAPHASLDEYDRLEVRTRLARLGGASLDLEQRFVREERMLVGMEVRLAVVSSALRAVRLPRTLIEALAPLRHDAAANFPVGA